MGVQKLKRGKKKMKFVKELGSLIYLFYVFLRQLCRFDVCNESVLKSGSASATTRRVSNENQNTNFRIQIQHSLRISQLINLVLK